MNIPPIALVTTIIGAGSSIIALAMLILVLWQGTGKRENQLAAFYMLTVVFWGASTATGRVAGVLGYNPSLPSYFIAAGIGTNSLALFALTSYYAGLWKHNLTKFALLFAIISTSVAIFFALRGEVITDIQYTSQGLILYRFQPRGYVAFGLAYAFFLTSLIIGLRHRSLLPVELIIGSILPTISEARLIIPTLGQYPIGSLTAEIVSILFARAILNAQLFNPLAQLNRQLADANKELEQASHLKSQFLANMSHELRTPLNSIIGYSELVISGIYGPVTDKQHDRLTKVLRNGQNLLALINDILDLSKIEAGRMELALTPIDLTQVIDNVIATLEPLAQEKGLLLTAEIPADLPPLKADANRVRQIITNLASNAVKFTREGGVTIRVSEDKTDNVLDIAVIDTGIGIPDDEIDKIFTEFHQVDGTATREVGGTGLGLTITRRLAQMHGGEVYVESKVDEGSTFTIRLPIIDRDQILKAQVTAIQPPIGPLVLVIDDEQEAVDIIREHLISASYRVAVAMQGDEAIRRAEELQPAAITLDLMMPGMDGWQILSQLRNNPKTTNIPIVIVSLLDQRPIALNLNVRHYIVKPINRDELLNTLQGAMAGLVKYPVLVVDDNPDDRDLVSTILSSAGYSIAVVQDGEAAIQWLSENQPQLVVLDLMMPKVSGFEVLAYIRTQQHLRNLPVVVVTAKTLTTDEERRLERSFVSVIQKEGLAREQLVTAIQHSLQPRT